MTSPLSGQWEPIVPQSLDDVGPIGAYEESLGEYAKLPFVPDALANLTHYVIEKDLGGLFHCIAKEEAAI